MPLDSETAKATSYAEKLLKAAIDLLGAAAGIELNKNWARDPKIVALTLLCRSASNFRAAVLLVRQGHVMEARSLVRCLYENLLWMGALRERGLSFIENMVQDEAFNRKVLGELALKLSSQHGTSVDDAESLTLRAMLKQLAEQFPTTKKLHANKTASESAVETAYIEYARLSLDATHCSVTALGRHLSSEVIDGQAGLTVSIEARTNSAERLSTVLHACRALTGTAIGANELLGFTGISAELAKLVREFEQNGWVHIN